MHLYAFFFTVEEEMKRLLLSALAASMVRSWKPSQEIVYHSLFETVECGVVHYRGCAENVCRVGESFTVETNYLGVDAHPALILRQESPSTVSILFQNRFSQDVMRTIECKYNDASGKEVRGKFLLTRKDLRDVGICQNKHYEKLPRGFSNNKGARMLKFR